MWVKLSLTVCDVCQDKDSPTTHFEVTGPTGRYALDLCEAHSQTLLGLLEVGTKVPARAARGKARSTPAAPTGSRARRVMSMKEIEQLKQGD